MHLDGEIRTYSFTVLRYLSGEGSKDIKVEGTYWERIKEGEVKPEAEKYDSGRIPRGQALQTLLKVMEREVEQIPHYSLKIMTEIFGVLAERHEEFAKNLFEHFKTVKSGLSSYPESEIKPHRDWALLLASALSWLHQDSINAVLVPYLAEELKGPDSRRADYVLSNIGTDAAIAETRKHYIGR